MKKSALFYAKNGLAVFPLLPHSKKPATENGFYNATTDLEQIEKWWNKNPNYNIGIATGKLSNGLVVIDVDMDSDKGKVGYETLKQWERENGPLPDTWLSITGSGGYHFIYRDDKNYNSSQGLYDDIDIKANGGYIVAPPSIHPNGHRYEWEFGPGDGEIAKVNDVVASFLKGPSKTHVENKSFRIDETIPESKRTSSLIALIGSLRAKNLGDDAIEAAVRSENESKCMPPLTDKELEKTVLSALKRDWSTKKPYFANAKEVEKEKVELLQFQKISKKSGEPYEILDDKIANYLINKQLKIIVLNGIPYLYQNGYYMRDEDGKILKAHIKALIWPELVTIGRINRVYNLILADYRLSKRNEDINNYPAHWVNFKNGMYDVINKALLPHDPKYLAVNQIPHDFTPDAKYKGPVVDEFLKGLFPDDGDREMFLAYAGYCMTIDTRIQKFMIIVGIPGSGKSTAINLLIDAIGSNNTSCVTLQDLNERFTPTELLGKLLNACADLPKKALDQVDAIKRITGEDLVKGEYKGGKVFAFRSYAKLIFSANEMPVNLDEKSEAFYRRILAIEVLEKGKPIPDLKNGLNLCMPGFINECMAALNRLYSSGKEIDSANSKKLVHNFHRESDSVQSFLDDCIDFVSEEKIERKKLYEAYEKYCLFNDWATLSNRAFFRNLRGKGLREHRSTYGRFFVGMQTKSVI